MLTKKKIAAIVASCYALILKKTTGTGFKPVPDIKLWKTSSSPEHLSNWKARIGWNRIGF